MNNLEYFIVAKGNIAVLSLKGVFGKDSGLVLEPSLQQLKDAGIVAVVLCCADLKDIDPRVSRDFTQFQRNLRNIPVTVRISNLNSDIKKMLLSQVLVQTSEIRNSLEEAVRELHSLTLQKIAA